MLWEYILIRLSYGCSRNTYLLVYHMDALLYDVCQIVHWRNHLRFPPEARLTPEAKDLICRFLCDAENRLGSRGTDGIKVFFLYHTALNWDNHIPQTQCSSSQAHPWFKGINWDILYEMEAAYKPEVNGELDTQNFMKYDEVASWMFHIVFRTYVCCIK